MRRYFPSDDEDFEGHGLDDDQLVRDRAKMVVAVAGPDECEILQVQSLAGGKIVKQEENSGASADEAPMKRDYVREEKMD